MVPVLRVDHGKGQIAFGDDLVLDEALTGGATNLAARLGEFDLNNQGITRQHRLAELDLVRAHEVTDATTLAGRLEHQNARDLRYGFHLEHARHDGVTGEMALEERFVDRDGFLADRLELAVEFQDAVDEQERVAVRQDLHDLVDIETGFARGDVLHRHLLRDVVTVLLVNGAGQFDVERVSGLGRDDAGLQPGRKQREIADDIEDLVTDELVLIPERFAGENGVATDDDGVLEAATLDETLLHERFHFLVEYEGAGLGDFLGVVAFVEVPVEVLRVLAGVVRVRTVHFEIVARPGGDKRAVLALDMNGLADVVGENGNVLFDATGLFERFHVDRRAAVADGGFVGVEFDHGVVDAETAQGGEQMFDRVDLHAALAEGGGAFDLFDVVNVGRDSRFVREIEALENVAGVGRAGLDGQGNIVTGVERGATDGLGITNRGLFQNGHERSVPFLELTQALRASSLCQRWEIKNACSQWLQTCTPRRKPLSLPIRPTRETPRRPLPAEFSEDV